uniref:Reverse transcriptase Ty1/copia-type domain-containing protein n=1 Tax=Tanacetum cinerariifolium TaxID=118510 RepID=A0A6L2KAC9_TANCI|nr:hypothetical protein [Tanacetum cinerariifolium]
MGHLARDCRRPRNQESRPRNQDISKKTVIMEDISSKAMVSIDEAGFDWSYMADDEVPTNMALIDFSDSEGLASVEEQLVFYKKNEVVFYDQIAVLKKDASFIDSKITALNLQIEKLKKEKESNQIKIDNFENASKSLDKLIGSQITDNSKTGLGFTSDNDVTPPPTGLFAPPTIDLSNYILKEFKQPEFEGYGPKASKSGSVDTSNKIKKAPDAPIIIDWVFNSGEDESKEMILNSKNVQHKPEQANRPRNGNKVTSVLGNKGFNVVKSLSCWVWRPKIKVQDHVSKNSGSYICKRFDYVDPECRLKHITGNLSYLTDIKEHNGGYVAFGGGAKGALDSHNKDKYGPSQVSKSDNQERPNAESSTKTINTIRPVNIATPIYAEYPNDPLMSDLEDVGIFDDAYDDRDEGSEDNYNNLETVIPVSLVPSIIIHKDHPKEHIIGEVNSETLVDLPPRKRAIETKWVYRNKIDQRGIVVRNKDRLFLDYASFMDFTVYKMDVKSTFLYDTFEEEVYVSQPLGFVDPEFPNKVYKVEKALYGDIRGTIDKTLFIKKIKDDILLVQVYVDEIIFGSTKRSLSTEFEQLMHKRFQMSSMGELTFFLGLLKRTFRYLKGQPTLGLWYPKDSPLEMIAYYDSDYAGASLDRKSTTGEYIVASNCRWQVIWLQNQLLDYGYNFMHTKIHVDNESAICVVKNYVYHSKTKHIEIRHHLIRDSYEKRLIEMVKIHTNYNVADLLTKAFDVTSAKTTSWNEFISTMSFAIICLATNQKFNFSRYILLSLVKNIKVGVPFFMFLRFVKLIINHQLGDMTHHKDIFATPSLTMKFFANIKRVGTGFSREVNLLLFDYMLKKHKPKRKHTQEPEVPLTESQVEHNFASPSHDLLPSGEDSLKLEELMVFCTNLSNKVLDFKIEVIDIKSTYQARIEKLESKIKRLEEENMVLKELKSVHSTVDSDEPIMEKDKSSKQERKIADIVADEPADVEEVLEVVKAAKLITKVEAQARKNMIMYLKNMAGYRMDYFKWMSYDEIRPLFEKHYNYNQAFLNKKQKMEQETEELKKNLQIVPDDDDDDDDDDVEDLESLWNIIKERFANTKPKNYSDDFLLNTLKIMFEKPNVEANVWKFQKGKYGLAKVKRWKLFESCGVHCLTLSTT